MRREIRKKLNRAAVKLRKQPPRYHITPALRMGRPFKFPMSEAEGDAILARLAPNWREHLYEGKTIDEVLRAINGIHRARRHVR
jgi:hypothetical protein